MKFIKNFISKNLNPSGYRLYYLPAIKNRKNGELIWVGSVYLNKQINLKPL